MYRRPSVAELEEAKRRAESYLRNVLIPSWDEAKICCEEDLLTLRLLFS